MKPSAQQPDKSPDKVNSARSNPGDAVQFQPPVAPEHAPENSPEGNEIVVMRKFSSKLMLKRFLSYFCIGVLIVLLTLGIVYQS
jgi:hypothetical protein